VQDHREKREHEEGGEHEVGLGPAVGEQHEVAEPLGGADPLADDRADRRVDGGQAQAGSERRQRRRQADAEQQLAWRLDSRAKRTT
jgi:hypothetical protein